MFHESMMRLTAFDSYGEFPRFQVNIPSYRTWWQINQEAGWLSENPQKI